MPKEASKERLMEKEVVALLDIQYLSF